MEIEVIFDNLKNTRLKSYISEVLGNDAYIKIMIDQMKIIQLFVESNDVIFFLFMKWKQYDFVIEEIMTKKKEFIV